MSDCERKCEFCDKRGLPILPVRYAIAKTASRVPKLTTPMTTSDVHALPEASQAQYTARLLRSGYLYVYDEARKRWDAYFVNDGGYYLYFDPKQGMPAALTKLRAPCTDEGHREIASCITIPDPKRASLVWLTFSDVEWTPAVLKKHEDAAYRKRHMRPFDVKAWLASQQQTHAQPLAKLADTVAEYTRLMRPHRDAFGASPFKFHNRQGQAENLIKTAELLAPKGAILALPDPVGISMEIASLMEVRKITFMNDEEKARPRFAASTIASLESSIKEQVKLAEIEAGEELARRAELGPSAYNPNPALWGMPGDLEEAKRWRTHTPDSLKRAADNAWKKYSHDRSGKPRFDAAASQDWLKKYNEEFQKFDVEKIAPLARAHVAWMQHPSMSSHMSCNYDSTDIASGIAYTATLVELLRYTTDKQPSYDLYLKWLTDGEFTEENLLMRALGFNQKELIDKLKQADAAPVDGRAFPSDAVAGAVAAFIEKMPAGANAQLTALLAGLSGPALKYWDDFNAGKVGSKAAAAMAAVSGKQFVRLPVVGNRGQFVQAYMRQMYALDPSLRTKPNELQAAIAKQLKLLEIEGVKMNSKSKLGWYVILDKDVMAETARKNLAGQTLADELAKAIKTPEDLKKMDMTRAVRYRNAAFGGATVLAGVLMAFNFTKLLDDVEKGMSHELAEAKTKLLVGKVAIAGFVAEQMGNGLEKLGEMRLRNMAGRFGGYMPNILKLAGRFAGFGVGVFLGLWDISKGVDARKGGDIGLSNAYFLSGGAAIGVTTTLFLVGMNIIALGPIGWIVLAVGVLIWLVATLFIETHKDNKLQEWLSRCYFGLGSDKYSDTKSHVEQYKLALAE